MAKFLLTAGTVLLLFSGSFAAHFVAEPRPYPLGPGGVRVALALRPGTPGTPRAHYGSVQYINESDKSTLDALTFHAHPRFVFGSGAALCRARPRPGLRPLAGGWTLAPVAPGTILARSIVCCKDRCVDMQRISFY